MARFADIKNTKARQVIVDFPYDDQELKVCLKVLSVASDLLADAKALEEAENATKKEVKEDSTQFNLRLKAEVVFRATYECEKRGEEWIPTDRLFFSSVQEIIDNVDQDLLVFLYEYYQNFRSISSKHGDLTPENIAIISHKMGGSGSLEEKANFFYQLPRHIVFNYLLFTGGLVVNLTNPKFSPISISTQEQDTDFPRSSVA